MLPAMTASQVPNGVLLSVHVKPFAPRSGFMCIRSDDRLVVALAAKPINGEANEELARYLADIFEVSPSSIDIAGGRNTRNKSVLISGAQLEAISTTIEVLLAPARRT